MPGSAASVEAYTVNLGELTYDTLLGYRSL